MPKIVRNKEIKIRLTDAEHRRLLSLSGNKALAPWLRDLGLGERELDLAPSTNPTPKVAPELIRQVQLIGNNINQISKSLNADWITPSQKIDHLFNLRAIEKQLSELLK